MTAPDSLYQLVETFEARQPANETEARTQFVDPLFGALGWDVTDNRQVSLEPTVNVLEDGFSKPTRSDYGFCTAHHHIAPFLRRVRHLASRRTRFANVTGELVDFAVKLLFREYRLLHAACDFDEGMLVSCIGMVLEHKVGIQFGFRVFVYGRTHDIAIIPHHVRRSRLAYKLIAIRLVF